LRRWSWPYLGTYATWTDASGFYADGVLQLGDQLNRPPRRAGEGVIVLSALNDTVARENAFEISKLHVACLRKKPFGPSH
jgi:hypothetical protein